MPRTRRNQESHVEEGLTESTERYLEAIFYIDAEGETVRAARLAEWLGVSQASTASALQRLAKAGLVRTGASKDIQLTPHGRTLASDIVRRHRIAERWLVDVLKFDWLTADQEASRLEHGMSNVVADRLYELIGRPKTCPHGNVIPGVTGIQPRERALSSLGIGERSPLQRISEVAEHEVPDLLAFLGENGFTLGGDIEVVDHSRGAGTVTVRVGGDPVSMSLDVAAKVWVRA